MNISADTKISLLIKTNPASIEAIASINKRFEKLRNPVLRKILAPRITIADAAKIGGCTVTDFFKKLLPLGFVITPDTARTINDDLPEKDRPDFMKEINRRNIIALDVRPDLSSGKDPFQKIMLALASMPSEKILLIINTFEPLPLINILVKKGFEYYTEVFENGITRTYLKSTGGGNINEFKNTSSTFTVKDDFTKTIEKYKNKIKTIDVRNLEMPLPMINILKELALLPEGYALFVYHKKIPQYLLPELQEKNFSWLINEVGEGDIKLLIFR